MKNKTYQAILLLSFLTMSCNKGNVNSGNGNGGGGGNNGGGGGGGTSLTVTGYLPQRPYPDDTLIINGTGFNPDKTRDTVLFNFALGKIVSATATQLKVTMPDVADINMTIVYTAKLEVRANGHRLPVNGGISFKRALQLYGIQNPDLFNDALGRPDDSLVLNGSGFNANGTGMHISIGTTTLANYNIDSNFQCKAMLRLPKLIFGQSNDENVLEQKKVSVTNADGKTDSKILSFYISPRMRVSGVGFEQNSYTKAALAGGAVVRLIIQGRDLKNDTELRLTGPAGSGFQSSTMMPVNGFPNSVIVSFGSNFTFAGNYHVNLWRGDVLYGGADFRVEN